MSDEIDNEKDDSLEKPADEELNSEEGSEEESEDLDDFLNLESLLEEATATVDIAETSGENADIRVSDQDIGEVDVAIDENPELDELMDKAADELPPPSGPSLLARLSAVVDKVFERFAFLERFINKVSNLKVIDKIYELSVATLELSKASYVSTKTFIINSKPYVLTNRYALITLGVLVTSFFVLLNYVGDPFFDLRTKRPYLTSLEEVADRIISVGLNESFESFYSPLRQPEFFMSMDEVIVQLKSTRRAPRAFGRFEFYIETNNRRSLIEVSDRRQEILDLMQRTLESQTWDDISTTRGKLKIKRLLRVRVNSIMNYGRVREIYFKNLLLKKSRF